MGFLENPTRGERDGPARRAPSHVRAAARPVPITILPAMAMRNIDFEALRSLRDRHGAGFPRGRVIARTTWSGGRAAR